MTEVIRTDSTNLDFQSLVQALDLDIAFRDPENRDFYHQYNGIENLNNVVIVYYKNVPAGCGAFKAYSDSCVEIKRMYVTENSRGLGIAGMVLKNLERWAREQGYRKAILETGKAHVEAIGLYTKHGYNRIPNFDQYKEAANSVCFAKKF